ncbi:C2H2 transcription factor [Pleurostoma richardsiae]|uniref:C2H2 transcription factor n=1 Tax=Pleurostoma richardsiae TaxID=41990 RepID=A0AA38R9M8_9PEZI|nr:C2H2 transcription factor [Pleurostoma richardsiae]
MDAHQYSSNVVNTSTSSYPSYPSPSGLSPQHLQQQGASSLQSQTLPPLQPQNPNMQSLYNHTPRTPATPNTPGSTTMGSYPPPPNQNPGRGSYQMMPNNPYPQPHQSYATSSAMLPQTSVAASHPQPIAPAPSPGGRVPPVLRPMPAGGVMQQTGLASPYGQSPLLPQPILQDNDQPTHVVGSQGRRGILPSAPGRPAAPAPGTAAKNQIPQKDADGKFPCPHCTKTYLHAKHLKRHLLRHTGDRPYMCVLCRDTFSRSDILKRHFQKCSIRRGNPTGASHLSHPHAHVKKNAQAQKNAGLGNEGDMNHMNGMNGMPTEGMVHPFGLIPAPDGMNNMANDQNQLSRSSSMNRMEDANGQDRRNVAGSVMGASQPYNGNVPNSMAANINPQLANYNMPANQNGMQMFSGSNSNQQSGLDWSQMFSQGGAQDTYVNSFPPPNIGQTQTAIKPEPNGEPARSNAVPAGTSNSDRSLFFGSWDSPHVQDPYQRLSDRILSFFYPRDVAFNLQSAGLNLYFSPENIKDFLEKYTHFHQHFPFLHIPTFRIMDAYTGLLAASHVREMMNFLKAALERDSRMLASLSGSQQPQIKTDPANSGNDLEELQALMLMHALFTWNGTPLQRESARQIFPVIANLARRAGFLRVSNDSSLFSPLHQPTFNPSAPVDASAFDWRAWVEQEKRIRVMHTIVFCDSAIGLYFNSPPQFDPFEVQIPLPCDEAAWDAPDAEACAEALGLRGPQAAKERNPDGTQRPKQPELDRALNALLHPSYQIQTGTTNLVGKFILIHALIAIIRRAQIDGGAVVVSGPNTPLSQNDWVVGVGQDAASGNASANNSGRGTPVEGSIPPQTLKKICTALEKFKHNWDTDMVNQFPPASDNPRRYGFSKDAIPFYWLANYLLKNTRPGDLQMAPDQRFMRVIHLLKSVKSWVISDGVSRGEGLGSVGEIDQDFGAANLTLDMARLFTPLPRVVESPDIASVKTEMP